MNIFQDEYVNHPDWRVYVMVQLQPYRTQKPDSNGRIQTYPPYVFMDFKFLGMTQEEAEPYLQPALNALGYPFNEDGKGNWTTFTYIKSIQVGGGIGMQSLNGTCKMWTEGLTTAEAEQQTTMAKPTVCSWKARETDPTCANVPKDQWTVQVPTFCGWDADFVTNHLYRALVMKKMSTTAIWQLLRWVLEAPAVDANGNQNWQFYLQIDPSSGAAGEIPVNATAYPWRSAEDMTLQVIAKWDGTEIPGGMPGGRNPTLESFNYLLVSVLQPYVGTSSYYNYADDNMPGGAIPLYSYFGANAERVVSVRKKYCDLRVDNGMEWELLPYRPNQTRGVHAWSDSPYAAEAVSAGMTLRSEVLF